MKKEYTTRDTLLELADTFEALDAVNDFLLEENKSLREQLCVSIEALKLAKDDIEAWREFCKGQDQGVGFGQSDFALRSVNSALEQIKGKIG